MTKTQPIPIYSQQQTFYIPRVEVFVRGQRLDSSIVDDILQVTYKDSINDIDSFSIEINNWDADKRTFKFAPAMKDFAGIFDPGAPVEIRMGYQDDTRRMMRGTVTSLEPNYSESSAPTLAVAGLNELHEFRTEQHTRSWLDGTKTDTDIARELCALPVKKGQAGLGIEIEAHPDPNEATQTFVYMSNQYDIVFLLERARRHGYEVYLKDGGVKPKLYFGLSENKANVPVYRLEWGKSLINFRPRLSTARQISSVQVRGWDRKSNSVIEEEYTLEKLWKDQGKSQAEIDRLRQIYKDFNRKDVVTNLPVHTKGEALKLARDILNDQSKKLIEATGSTVGLPDLRSGVALEIAGFGAQTGRDGKLVGAGSDFDGEYYVTATTHTIGNGGYRTEFSARREGPLPQPAKTTGGH